jgi:chromosomal replication initiation ATPase DnaA
MDESKDDVIDDVLDVITAFYGVTLRDVLSARRSARVHTARCVGIYLAHKAGLDSHQIGQRFGGRDHTIIEAVCRNTADNASTDLHQRRLLRDLDAKRRETTARRDRIMSP